MKSANLKMGVVMRAVRDHYTTNKRHHDKHDNHDNHNSPAIAQQPNNSINSDTRSPPSHHHAHLQRLRPVLCGAIRAVPALLPQVQVDGWRPGAQAAKLQGPAGA